MKTNISPNNHSFPLRLAGRGEKVKVISLMGGKGLKSRLNSVGLNIGTKIEILENPGNGKILLSSQGGRFYLGGGMAQKIQVAIA